MVRIPGLITASALLRSESFSEALPKDAAKLVSLEVKSQAKCIDRLIIPSR